MDAVIATNRLILCPKIYEQIDIKALLQNHNANPPGDAQ
jgi:hypothetical protein